MRINSLCSQLERALEEMICTSLKGAKRGNEIAAFVRPGPAPPHGLSEQGSPAAEIRDQAGEACHYYLSDIKLTRAANGHSIPCLDPRCLKVALSEPMRSLMPFLFHRTSMAAPLSSFSRGLLPGSPAKERNKRCVNCLSPFPPWDGRCKTGASRDGDGQDGRC